MSSQLPLPPEARQQSRPFWKRWWFLVLVAVVLLIIASATASEDGTDEAAPSPTPEATTSSPTPSPTAAEVLVPDVTRQNVKAATRALEAMDLEVDVVTKVTDAEKEGSVLSQSVEPGSSLAVGGTVALTVAEAFPTIPNVVGDRLTAARRTLENRRFEVRVKRETSSQPKDTVIRQSPVGGTSARPGRTVLLVVAKPSPPSSSGGSYPYCTPGYSPCLPPAPDYDCAGGSGDGPRYVSGPVTVSGSDPYDLDGDGDGVGCE